MRMVIRVAIIGLGIMGRRMLVHMQLHDHFSPLSLWDPDPAACDAARALAPEAEIMTSADAAIRNSDLVYLACPPRCNTITPLPQPLPARRYFWKAIWHLYRCEQSIA